MLKKSILFIKKHLWQSLTFLLGAIVVILLTKAADDVLPNSPTIVKEITDTLRIVHKYELPQSSSSNDTLNLLLQEKLNQISQLNLYEKELEDYYKRVRNKENNALNDIPNKIILDQSKRLSAKGYTQEDATAFFESDCPEIRDQKFIDFRFNFLSTEMISEIYCLRLSIYKKSNDKYLQSYFDDFFEVRQSNNFIRITNDLPSGQYEFQYGIMLKRDIKKDFPALFVKKCYATIK